MGIIFTYSFDTTAKNQLDSGNTADPDSARADVKRGGDNTTSNGRGWQITTDANYPGGLGGCGLRHWRADGTNSNTGGIICDLPGSYTELWFRFYMRYQSGFSWTSGEPGYTKDIYGEVEDNYWIYGIQQDGWGVTIISSENHDGVTGPGGAFTWEDLMGGTTGDGEWHCHEFHVKKGNGDGVIQVWVDDDLKFTESNLTLGTAAMTYFLVGSNQDEVTGAGSADYYTDYDDIVISDSGRVGPIAGGGGFTGARNAIMRL